MANITLNWDDNPPAELIEKYEVFQSYNGGISSLIGETPDSFYDIVDAPPGSYVFDVRAVNLAGAGPHSDPVNGPALPSKPTGLTIVVS